MKLIIILTFITITKTDILNRKYIPPHARTPSRSSFFQTPSHSSNGRHRQNMNGYFGTPITVIDTSLERPYAQRRRNPAILRHDQTHNGNTYSYVYKTENGIYAEEKGVINKGVKAQGGYSYVGDDGQTYSVRYTADENGFVPQGDHLPTPPAIPKEILRALEQNARDEAAGIFDDGSYDATKYSGPSYQKYNSHPKPHYLNRPNMQPKMYLPPITNRNNQRLRHKRLIKVQRFSMF